MNATKEISLKKSSGLWCGQRKRPSVFMFENAGHLTAAFLFNFLNFKHYDCKNQFRWQ